ncbi:hypothetical protein H2198_007058 [Neophaeococcomyces mojaviensis]|uniref:Uncharacterized protein n=1 Tax=Neophaeococcomyces mojaviensis TaxID=3383035 RepID=A0ACC3A140_9EURO|nr:hypothetical protein H2198_007058 [Knufia sp. JES_112]
MAQGQEEQVQAGGVETIDQQPSSPAGSASSREERNAREGLKKASIAGLSQKAQGDETPSTTDSAHQSENADPASMMNNGIRGRPAKKRSFEDLAKDDADIGAADGVAQPPLPKSGHHKRMRSRDIASGDHSQAYNKLEGDLNETLHEETDIDAQKSPGGPGVLVDVPSQEEMDSESTAPTHNKAASETMTLKGNSTQPQPTSKPVLPSGFANTSAASPFGRTRSPTREKSPEESSKATSSSAFASSGLSAFASSEKSPFGAAGSKSPTGFGGGQSTGGFGSSKGGFGSATTFPSVGTSAFAAGSSAFGSGRGFGGGFGAPKPFGAPSAFGASSGPTSFGTGKPFASSSKEEEEEEGGDEEDEAASSIANDDDKQDPRFRDQHGKVISALCGANANEALVDTGEEDEEVHFSARAKLYVFAGKDGWKDRGTGVFKINVRTVHDEAAEGDVEAQASSGKKKARLLMRADATHRVILNSPIFKGMRFGAPDGSEPAGKVMHLQSLEDGKPLPLQIKIGKEEVLRDLYHRLQELEQDA